MSDRQTRLKSYIEDVIALAQARLDGNEDEAARLVKWLYTPSSQDRELLAEALFGCLKTDVPGASFLTRPYMDCSDTDLFRKRFHECCQLATDGNPQFVRILAYCTAGVSKNSDFAEKAGEKLVSCGDGEDAAKVVAGLAETFQETGDESNLLVTLATVAQTHANLASTVLPLLRQVLAESPQMKHSAAAGLVALFPYLAMEDAELIAKNFNPRVLKSLKQFGKELPAELGVELSERLSVAVSNDANVVKALFPLVGFATKNSIAKLSLSADNNELGEYLLAVMQSQVEPSVRDVAFETYLNGGLKGTASSRRQLKTYAGMVPENEKLDRYAHLCLEKQRLPEEEIFLRELQTRNSGAHAASAELFFRLGRNLWRQQNKDGAFMALRRASGAWEESSGRVSEEYLSKLQMITDWLQQEGQLLEAEKYSKKAVDVGLSLHGRFNEQVGHLMHKLADLCDGMGRQAEAKRWRNRAAATSIPDAAPDDHVDRALFTYVRLPAYIDLELRSEGITLDTDDFPALVKETSGLDLLVYFQDSFKDADFLTAGQKDALARDLFETFRRIKRFVSGSFGARLELEREHTIELPPGLSHSLVQLMTVARVVGFRLDGQLPHLAKFTDISGITFTAGRKVIALKELELKADGGKCIVTPKFDEQACLTTPGGEVFTLQSILNKGKEFIIGMAVKHANLNTEFPVSMDEFAQYFSDAMNFKSLLRDEKKDLLVFVERLSKTKIEDPFTSALLMSAMQICKKGESLELKRLVSTICDLGGVLLTMSPHIQFRMFRDLHELKIERLQGLGVQIPFEPPAELQAIGLDLSRSLPHEIISLHLTECDENGVRKLTAGTAPMLWLAFDVGPDLQPARNELGQWILYGYLSNPISGQRQPFYIRLDASDHVAMTTKEIADLVAQTALHGFELSDPRTWPLGALGLLGRRSIAQSVEEADELVDVAKEEIDDFEKEVRRGAKQLGRLFGWLLKDDDKT